jgi:hypothetical protein
MCLLSALVANVRWNYSFFSCFIRSRNYSERDDIRSAILMQMYRPPSMSLTAAHHPLFTRNRPARSLRLQISPSGFCFLP